MVLDTVISYIFKAIDGLVNTFLKPDNILYIGVGFTLLMIIFFSIKSHFSYESKLERAVDKLNHWLNSHQTLTENNLLEFNNLIKSRRTPKILRKHWQQYMLYRDKLPSEYMSAYNCIDKPSKTSSFKANIKNLTAIYITTAILTFCLTLFFYRSETTSIISSLVLSLITPTIIVIIGLIATLILRSLQNSNLASLYEVFHIFNRYIDKASVTIPKYVDFEILFTKKEIRNGIPILGEYLEKRARQEQEELEEAQRNAVSHEEYDFSSSGVDGSLVLERAMKESETYLNFKQRTLAEIQQFESEISTLKKNYENTSKDYQRKLQVSKENMERLRQQQEESTNRIEVNYLRKQQQDEVKKQELLEKEQDDATNKFNAEINVLSQEIEKRRIELEDKKQKVQESMESEYQTFSAKLHKTIATDVEKASQDSIQKILTEKDQYAQAITYLKTEVDNKDAIISAKDQTIEELQNRINSLEQQASSGDYTSNQAQQFETEEYIPLEESDQDSSNEQESSEDGHYDERGYYWFNDKTYYDADGLYHDLEGNVYDSDSNLLKTNEPVEEEFKEELDNDSNEVNQEEILESNLEIEEIPSEDINKESAEENLNISIDNQEETVTEIAPENLLETNEAIIEEFNINPQETVTQEQATTEPVTKEEVTQEPEAIPEGHYDDEGYYWFNDKTYYDPTGLYHDINGNVYDTDGNLVATNQLVKEETNKEVTAEEPNTKQNEEQPKKRGVGRPRKEKSPGEENKPKRKVGRPRKEKAETDEEVKPKRSVGRPRKEKSPEEENKPKRKVGRPRKEVSEEENKPKRSVGRPKKEKTVSSEEVKPKRSVGRPKKEKSTTEVKEEPKPKKRSVGRPKKTEQTQQSEVHLDILKQLGQSLLSVTEKTESKKPAKKSLTKKSATRKTKK